MSRHDTIRYRDKFCPACEVQFTPRTGRQTYCSKACRLGRGTCHTCGKRFVKTKKTTGLYCSPECWHKVMGKRLIPDRECKHCGKTFRPRGPEQRHCSPQCGQATAAKSRATRPQGTKRLQSDGYVMLKVGSEWVREHRHVMEQILGRELESHECVHHRDGDRTNNDPSNLELWRRKTGRHPQGIRAVDYHCNGCRCHDRADPRVIPH